MNLYQQTIGKPVSLSGKGLHTGKQATLTFRPAEPDFGIQFCRTDLAESPTIKADADFVINTLRSTTLSNNGATVITTEHALSALMGLQIDNVLIEINNEEVPILDGSAQPFINALTEAGTVIQETERRFLILDEPFHFTYPPTGSEYVALPSTELQMTTLIDFNQPVIGKQYAAMNSIGEFASQIAPARTFCFLSEVEALMQNNLIKGGSLDNAIVYADLIPSDEMLQKLAVLTGFDNLKVQKEGYLNNVELNFNNEAARHKLLDVVGDLALLGSPLKARVFNTKPGHAANIAFVKELKKYFRKKSQETAPAYDPNQTPLYDVTAVQKLLPHRPPFLLIDKIMLLTKERVIGVKNVTINEPFFTGHFPGQPVMPGVLIVEAMAQAGGALVMQSVPDPENYLTFFLKIDNVRFRKPVVPGDTLIFELKLLADIRRGIAEMDGFAYVGNKLVTEARLVAQISKRKNA